MRCDPVCLLIGGFADSVHVARYLQLLQALEAEAEAPVLSSGDDRLRGRRP